MERIAAAASPTQTQHSDPEHDLDGSWYFCPNAKAAFSGTAYKFPMPRYCLLANAITGGGFLQRTFPLGFRLLAAASSASEGTVITGDESAWLLWVTPGPLVSAVTWTVKFTPCGTPLNTTVWFCNAAGLVGLTRVDLNTLSLTSSWTLEIEGEGTGGEGKAAEAQSKCVSRMLSVSTLQQWRCRGASPQAPNLCLFCCTKKMVTCLQRPSCIICTSAPEPTAETQAREAGSFKMHHSGGSRILHPLGRRSLISVDAAAVLYPGHVHNQFVRSLQVGGPRIVAVGLRYPLGAVIMM